MKKKQLKIKESKKENETIFHCENAENVEIEMKQRIFLLFFLSIFIICWIKTVIFFIIKIKENYKRIYILWFLLTFNFTLSCWYTTLSSFVTVCRSSKKKNEIERKGSISMRKEKKVRDDKKYLRLRFGGFEWGEKKSEKKSHRLSRLDGKSQKSCFFLFSSISTKFSPLISH